MANLYDNQHNPNHDHEFELTINDHHSNDHHEVPLKNNSHAPLPAYSLVKLAEGASASSHINYMPAKDVWEANVNIAVKKVTNPLSKMATLGFLAGVYVSMGGFLAVKMAADLDQTVIEADGTTSLIKASGSFKVFVMGFMFPLGLIFILINGAELFTGNTATLIPAIMTKKITWRQLAKSWSTIYCSNFVGALFWGYFFVYLVGAYADTPFENEIISLAIKKTSRGWGEAFLLAVSCNWFVNLAIALCNASIDVMGKIAGAWFAIMAFVCLGLEHCIANMFFIPCAMFFGADISVGTFIFKNLIPVTIGNICGGSILVGIIHSMLYVWHPTVATATAERKRSKV